MCYEQTFYLHYSVSLTLVAHVASFPNVEFGYPTFFAQTPKAPACYSVQYQRSCFFLLSIMLMERRLREAEYRPCPKYARTLSNFSVLEFNTSKNLAILQLKFGAHCGGISHREGFI